MKLAGFDWIWIYGDHGNFDCSEAVVCCAIHAGGPKTFVKLLDHSPTQMKRVLDIGADGIILPYVKSLEEVGRVLDLHRRFDPADELGLTAVSW